MDKLSDSVFFFASLFCGLLTGVVVGDTCRKSVLRENWAHDKTSRRRSWDTVYFECDDGCCGEPYNQECCPEDDDDDDDDDDDISSSGLVTGFSVAIVIVIVAVAVVVLGCVCYRARQKRSTQRRSCGRRRNPTVSTTMSSASLPPSYELSTTQPGMSPSVQSLPPSYEEVMAVPHPSDPSVTPYPRDRVISPVSPDLARGKDNQAFSV